MSTKKTAKAPVATIAPEAPAPEVIEAPAPEVIEAPAPEVIEAPAPEVIEAPAPEVIEAPEPEVIEAPAPTAADIRAANIRRRIAAGLTPAQAEEVESNQERHDAALAAAEAAKENQPTL